MSETTVDDQTRIRPPRCAWIGLFVLALTLFMAMLEMTIVFLALPGIAADLRPGATEQLWMLHAGEIVGVGAVLTIGRLADRFGARRVLAIAVTCYGLASLLAALATSPEQLIGARVLLGASAAAFAPSGMVLVRRLFVDERAFAVAIGLFMASASAGMALGPPIGGVLVDAFSWQAIFGVNVAMALVALPGMLLLPRVPAQSGGRIDPTSVAASIAAVALFVGGVQELASGPFRWWEAGLVLAGTAVGIAFWRRQGSLSDPLLDPALFGSRTFSLAVLGIGLVIVAQVGAELQMAQHLQTAMGLSPGDAGLLLIVPAGLAVLGTSAAPLLLRWFTPAQVIAGGSAVAVIGALGVAATATATGTAGVVSVISGMAFVEVGAAPMFGLGAGLVVASAPAGRVGSASAVQDVSGGLGNTFGLMIGGIVSFVVYQGALAGRLPQELTAGDREAAVDSVGAAIATAERLADPVGSDLAAAAREAFAGATRALYLYAAVMFVVIAVLAWRGLRDARLGDSS